MTTTDYTCISELSQHQKHIMHLRVANILDTKLPTKPNEILSFNTLFIDEKVYIKNSMVIYQLPVFTIIYYGLQMFYFLTTISLQGSVVQEICSPNTVRWFRSLLEIGKTIKLANFIIQDNLRY